MKQYLLFFLCFCCLSLVAQNKQGTIHFNGRVIHMYNEDNYQIKIPYESQNTNGMAATIYFDSSACEVDLIASIAYTLNVTHQKEKEWVLYLERLASDARAETILYSDMKTLVFDSLELNYDTTRSIVGYTCNLARYQLNGINYEAWFTKDILLGSNLLPLPNEIDGTCLEFTINMDIVDVKYTAFDFDEMTPNANRFEMIIPENYSLYGEPLFPVKQMKTIEVKNYEHDKIPPPPPMMKNH